MQKEQRYERAIFPAHVIRKAFRTFLERLPEEGKERIGNTGLYMSVETPDGEWKHDTEDEFFSDYHKHPGRAYFDCNPSAGLKFNVVTYQTKSTVTVGLPNRADIGAVFAVFDEHSDEATIPKPQPETPQPTIFIGHGGNPQWRDLKDHLHDHHGYDVMAYEVGARAGHTIRDILEDMLGKSSFAVLVMTAEDEDAQGHFHARANVIHELGLFQGKLGFTRAVALLEEGTEEFSNIHGIHQIRFGKGNIKETFGEVLATLRREFNTSS